MIKRWVYDSDRMSVHPEGQWIGYKDYQSLQAALKEALDGWEEWGGSKEDADRIEFLRKQFDLTL